MNTPSADALPLSEAFRRFSEPYAVKLAGDRPASRWNPKAKDARSQATNPFFEQLHRGELRWWGRHNGVSGPWVELRGSDVALVEVVSWPHGIVHRLEWFPRQVERPSALSYFARREPWLPPRQFVAQTSGEWRIAEKWFDVRIAQVATSKRLRRGEVAEWIDGEIKAGRLRHDRGMWNECKRELGGDITERLFKEIRDARMKCLGASALPRGRKRTA
jgi:hypothetical protein